MKIRMFKKGGEIGILLVERIVLHGCTLLIGKNWRMGSDIGQFETQSHDQCETVIHMNGNSIF